MVDEKLVQGGNSHSINDVLTIDAPALNWQTQDAVRLIVLFIQVVLVFNNLVLMQRFIMVQRYTWML